MTTHTKIDLSTKEINALTAMLRNNNLIEENETVQPTVVQQYKNKHGDKRITLMCSVMTGDDDDA